MRWVPFVFLVTLCLRRVYSCVSNSNCIAVCLTAGGGSDCFSTLCNPTFRRCDCSGDGVLRLDDTCKKGPVPKAQCTPAFNVTFNVAAWGSPELRATDVISGPSAQLKHLLALGTAAAVGANLSDISVSEVKLRRELVPNSTAPTGLLTIDLDFSFCFSDSISSADVGPGVFELGFKREVEKYAAFKVATIALIHWQKISDGTEASAPLKGGEWQGSSQHATPDNSDGADAGEAMLAFSLIAASVVVVLVISVATWAFFRRSRQKVSASDPELDEEQPGEPAESESRILAHVAAAFRPEEVDDDKVFQESCIEILEGDVVEVVAGGGGWFYGRVLSSSSTSVTGEESSERVGYFPENCVSWIGSIPGTGSNSQVSGPEQHFLVSVEHGFSPRDMEGGGEAAQESFQCLSLAAGEVVEVLASGGGWIFGHVAGSPDRVGYFPENRATWLGQCASGADATQTGDGMLVQVVKNFSPGVPGDSEEEATESFADSCIALAEGDVVEVAAAGGGWVYGRVVGAPDRVGYFPETRVAWLGRPVVVTGSMEATAHQAASDSGAGPGAAEESAADAIRLQEEREDYQSGKQNLREDLDESQQQALREAAHAALHGTTDSPVCS
eukprot:TRINITY_DN29936_c0_g1_i1.p1 TRINITY_DN29936_c0_g1~~TRINITY_DN29936_c0_g1_i1.p1  ORF type:complete len:615 (-),score=110.54 TRINITY_DN29936_c0_g1_i1:22-1866(-)